MSDSVKSPGTAPEQIPDSAITTDDDREDRLRSIRERFSIMQSFWSEIHDEALEDDRFVAGNQWSEAMRNEREEDGRPCLTYNLIPSFNRQITNRIRQERPQIKVTPVETNKGRDPRLENIQGTKDYSMADVYEGVVRNIEHVSRADQAYDTAVKHAVDHGFGFFYLINQWSKLDPFVQELRIHRVKNSYSVLMDPDSQEADYRDAKDAFLFTDMRKSVFEQKYPDVPFSEFAGATMGSLYTGWYESDHVRVAQYFWIDYIDDYALMLSNGKLVYENDVIDILDDLERDEGIHVAIGSDGKPMRKAVKRPVCMWQKMTADEILEGPLELPFSAIPIFPVLGEEVITDGKIAYESAFRHAKDAQRSYNYWRTAATETVALAPKAPWVGSERQFEGHEDEFEEANRKNLPYISYKHVDNIPPPQRSMPAMPAAAELQNAIQDGVDMQTIIGLHDASLGREGNEKSGKAIIARQNAGATSTFQFPDNLSRALEQCGRLIVEAIPKLYDTQRIIRIRMPDGTNDFVEINTAVEDKDTGKIIMMHDIAYGKYDVTMETGPSYATMRQEAADLQIELLKVLPPQAAQNIVHLIVQNLGVPGSEEVARILRKMLPENLKSEQEKLSDLPQGVSRNPKTGEFEDENGQPWQPPITPEVQALMQQNQIEQGKVEAMMAKSEAEKATAQAKIKQAEADLAEAQAEIERLRNPVESAGPDVENLTADLRGAIQEAMEAHADDPKAHGAMNIEEKIAEAVVDALKRVRGYVDKTVKQIPASENNVDQLTTDSAVVAMTNRVPIRIDHIYNDDGEIIQSVPVFADGEGNEQMPDRVEHEHEGDMVKSVPIYKEE